MARNVKLVKMLSSLDNIHINVRNMRGETMLHRVAASTDARDVEIAKIILAHPAVDINVRNRISRCKCTGARGGDAPLHVATREGSVEVVRMLMNRADCDVNVLNARDQQPIALAALRRNKEIFEMLFDHRDVHINTPLKFARLLKLVAGRGRGDYNDEWRDVVRVLATHEMLDVSSPLYGDIPVLVWAADNLDPYLVKLLLERNDTDVNIRDTYGHTALHSCFLNGYPQEYPGSLEIAKLLLAQKDINLHIRNFNMEFPADAAEEVGCLEIYKQLLLESSVAQQNVSDVNGSADASPGPSTCCVIL